MIQILDSKLLSDEELRKLFAEPLSEDEAEAMNEADEAAASLLTISLREVPDLLSE